MTNKKTSFILPCDCLEDIDDFSNEEAGQLFKAILKYADGNEEPEFFDRAMKIYFRRIKRYIDSANENYQKRLETNRQNGKKGGRPKKKTEKTDGFYKKGYTESDTETETESDFDYESESEAEWETDAFYANPPAPVAQYGENKNILLTNDEYLRLAEQMGVSRRDEYIEKLSDYIASKGKNYRSHYATIRNWFRRDGGKKDEPSYDIAEFVAREEKFPVYVPRER